MRKFSEMQEGNSLTNFLKYSINTYPYLKRMCLCVCVCIDILFVMIVHTLSVIWKSWLFLLMNDMQMDPESHIGLWNIFVSLLQKCFYSVNRHYAVAKCIV